MPSTLKGYTKPNVFSNKQEARKQDMAAVQQQTTGVSIKAKTIKGEIVTFPIYTPGLIYGLIVTPDLATWFLEFSKDLFNNRQQSPDRIKGYAEDMAANRWRHTGDTLKFNLHGVMVDGYTRCAASYLEDVTFVTDVRTGVSNESVEAIDTGRPRSLANALTMANEKVGTGALAHGIIWTWRYSRRNLADDDRKNKMTHGEAKSFLDSHPRIRESVIKTSGVRNKKLAPPGVLVAAHYICSHASETRTEEFFEALATGAELGVFSPIRVLREALLRRSEKRFKNTEILRMILHSFNKWNAGDTMRMLKIPEELPRIKGFNFDK